MARKAAKSETINVGDADAVEKIRAMTNGRGADVCVDAVGFEADRKLTDKLKNIWHMEMGSLNALKAAISAVRRGGVVSVVGVYGMPYDAFPLGQIFDKGIKMAFGQAPGAEVYRPFDINSEEGKIRLDDIITHRLPLDEAPRAYQIFRDKEDNCVKVVLKP